MVSFWTEHDKRLFLNLKITPGSSKSQVVGLEIEGNQAANAALTARLKIKIAAAPEDGKANAALIQFLSKLLDCPKKDIVVESGEKSRLKTVSVPAANYTCLQEFLKES